MPLALGATLFVVGLAAVPPIVGAPARQDSERLFQGRAGKALTAKCATCHHGSGAPGGLDLAAMKSAKALATRPGLAEKALLYIRTRHMPPAGSTPLTREELESLSELFESVATDVASGAGAGKVTLRRLNRLEYTNSVRDLLGVEAKLAADFPNDDVGYGFDTIGDVLSMSPLLFEKYIASAEQIAATVVPATAALTVLRQGAELNGPTNSNATPDGELNFFANGTANTAFATSVGQGTLKVALWAMQAGPEPAKAVIRAGGKNFGTIEVKAGRAQPLVVEIPLELSQGQTRVEVSFVNDYYNPSHPDPAQRDRNLILAWVELSQTQTTAQPSAARDRLVAGFDGKGDQDEVARLALARLAERAYRRPITAQERDRVRGVFDRAKKEGADWESAVQAGIVYALSSPSFLFRPETGAGKPDSQGDIALGPYELASRLSYFLWASVPDEALLAAAKDGSISRPDVLSLQVDRMLRDPRSRGLADGFAAQWLLLRKLEIIQPDKATFPAFTPELRSAMAQETLRLFSRVVRGNLPVTEFVASPTTDLNGLLARHYGIEPKTDGWETYTLPPERRLGILGHSSILTVTSNPNRTSPVKRGKFVLEQILGTPLPPPPPDVGVIADDLESVKTLSIRERMARHSKDPSCAGCHRAMDPIGFSLEAFDGIGRVRKVDEGGFPVEKGGDLPDGTKLDGPTGLKRAILDREDEYVRHLGSQLFTYAVGRGPRPEDRAHINGVRDRCLKNGLKMGELVKGVVLSKPFRYRSTR